MTNAKKWINVIVVEEPQLSINVHKCKKHKEHKQTKKQGNHEAAARTNI